MRPRRGKWPSASQPQGVPPSEESVRHTTRKTEQPAKRRANPAAVLWTKALAAAASAKVLLDTGDWDGAANRAYYAAFGGARAVLARVRASYAESKGHSTIVRRFEKHIVQERGLDPALGRPLIGRLSHSRWVADYDNVRVEEGDARQAVDEAERFLSVIAPLVAKANR